MRKVIIQNPSVERTYKTYIDSDYSSGTAVTVKSNVSFAANDLTVYGEPSEEYTELKKISSLVATTGFTLPSTLNFPHQKGTSVYKVVWDYVSLEQRTSSAGVFAEITQSPIQWDSKTNETIYFDPNATSAYEYRFRFYNSVTNTYSEYSPTVTGALPTRRTVQYMLDMARKIGGDPERKIVGDDELIRVANRGQDIIYAHNQKYWFLYVDTYELGSGSIAATAAEDKYSLGSLSPFGHLAGLKYRYASGSEDVIYQLRRISEAEFDREDSDQNITADNHPSVYKLLPADSSSANGYIKVTPDIKDSSVGTFYPLYYEKMADLDSVEDTTQVPLPDLLVDYMISYIFRVKGDEKKADLYERYLVSDSPKMVPPGLLLLDKLDAQQKTAVGQPVSLSRFRGQNPVGRLYGNRYPQSPDYYRENYF